MSVFSTKAPPGVRGRSSSSPRRNTRDRAPIHPMVALNHQVGNSTLQRWMAASGIQAKLHVTEPNDRHEKEADNVANKVMRSPMDTKPVDEPISRVGGGAPTQRLTGSPLLHHPEPLDQTHEGSPIIQREPEGPVQSQSADESIQKSDESVQPKTEETLRKKTEEPVQRIADESVQKADEPVQSKSDEPIQKADEPTQSKHDEAVQRADEPVPASTHDETVQKADESVQSKHEEPVQKTDDPVQSKSHEEPMQKADESVQPKHDEPVQKADVPVQSKSDNEPVQKADEPVQTKAAAASAPAVPVGFATGLAASRGEGRPLPSESRSFFEKRIGANFSSVRIHADQRGADLSRSVHAKAFTRANHIYFGQGQYSPHTSGGQFLLAHELTHVVQQGHATVQRQSSAAPIQRAPEEEGRAVSDEQRAQALVAAARAAKIAAQAKAFGQRETAKSKQEKQSKVASEQAHKQKAAQHKASRKAPAGGKHRPVGKGGRFIVLPPTQTPARGKAPHSPFEDPAFHKMVNRAAGAAKRQKHHVPATAKAEAAQAAAVMPPEQTTGTAQGNQAAAMQNAPTPGFNAAAFKAQLMSRIQELTPKTTEQADEFKNNNQLGAIKQDMSSKVSDERGKASGPLEEKKDEEHDTKSVAAKPITPLS